jgi:C-terminal processing protease CtpA/Prc
VNVKGDLIGINTAIASQTGSYSGYSFAIPAKLVQKVVNDLREFGEVQRGFLGIVIRDVNAELAEKENLKVTRGVFVSEVNEGSAAGAAGVQKGDVIIQIDQVKVNNSSELQEQVGLRRPGDKVQVTLLRKNKEQTLTVTLKNKGGKSELAKVERSESSQIIGADLTEVPTDLKEELKIKGGVQVKNLRAGLLQDAGVSDDFIITHIDKQVINTPEDALKRFRGATGAMLIEGLYPNGRKAYYAISF